MKHELPHEPNIDKKSQDQIEAWRLAREGRSLRLRQRGAQLGATSSRSLIEIAPAAPKAKNETDS